MYYPASLTVGQARHHLPAVKPASIRASMLNSRWLDLKSKLVTDPVARPMPSTDRPKLKRMSWSPTTDESDAQIIRRSVVDAEAFGEIFSRHYDDVFRFVSKRRGTDRVADTTSEVFMTAFRVRERFDTRYESCRPWLFGIATNAIGDALRKQRRDKRIYVAVSQLRRSTVGHDASVEDQVLARQFGEVFNTALGSLRRMDRETLLLKALDDLSYQEIALVLSIPIGTVRSRLNRARKQLRALVPESTWDLQQTSIKQPLKGWAEDE